MPEQDFSHYYTYDELTAFINACAEEHPGLAQVESIGTSHEGRDIWLVMLTNSATGQALQKPAFWIDANTHAGEVTGSAVALYIINHCLSNHGTDPAITRLLDDFVVYVLPRITVDGSEKYLTTPHMLRSSVRRYPYLDDRDGLYPEDLNGDGLLLQMRLKDPNGPWKKSEKDPRVMIRREPEEYGGEYYYLLPEGVILNWDGVQIKIAPPREGLDFNRNYPFDWAPEGVQRGAGDFPFSEPETRAEAEFWRNHRNINGFITYHTWSGVVLRPYSTQPDDAFPVEDLDIYKLIGDRATELTGYECVSVYHKFRYHPKEVLHGGMDDYGYDHFGWFGFTVELWDAPGAAGVKKEDYIQWIRHHPEEDDLKLIAWNDEKLSGRGFANWEPFEHPQLGEVEIGGWRIKEVWQNTPPEYLQELCEKQARFAIAQALMSPRLNVRTATVRHQADDLYHLTLVIENSGFLPTYSSKKAMERKAVRPIEVELMLPAEAKLVAGELKQEVGQLEGRSNKVFGGFAGGASPTDNLCKLEWVVKAPQGGEVEFIARAERAGTVRATRALE